MDKVKLLYCNLVTGSWSEVFNAAKNEVWIPFIQSEETRSGGCNIPNSWTEAMKNDFSSGTISSLAVSVEMYSKTFNGDIFRLAALERPFIINEALIIKGQHCLTCLG
jgi:hypothetical protein